MDSYQQISDVYAYGVPVTTQNTNVMVVSGIFCCPYPIELIVKKKCKGLSGAKLEVVDLNSNVVLRVDGPSNSFNKKRVLRNPAGYPLLTMREKLTSLSQRWTVHRGEGSDPTELMFTVQRSFPLQWRARLDVFFQTNQVRNFRVVGTYFDDSAKVYLADTLIAEVKENSTFGGFFRGKQDFVVRINAGVDYAFIVSLLVILNENNTIFSSSTFSFTISCYSVMLRNRMIVFIICNDFVQTRGFMCEITYHNLLRNNRMVTDSVKTLDAKCCVYVKDYNDINIHYTQTLQDNNMIIYFYKS